MRVVDSYTARSPLELSVAAGETVDVVWPSRAMGCRWCITTTGEIF